MSMPMLYRLAADLIVVVHAAFVLTVILGQVLIMLGWLRNWSWVRRWSFRLVHTGMILFVVLESWLGITCPLTVWEQQLRTAAGQATYEGDFIANFVHEALFFDLPTWAFTLIYSLFGLLVVSAWWWCPPQRRPPRMSSEDRSRQAGAPG